MRPSVFPSHFTARDGEFHGHLFENAGTDLARNLYWNIHVEFEPVALLGEQWGCVFQCEWLLWPVKSIRDLNGMGLRQVCRPELFEASLYLVSEHHWVVMKDLLVRHLHGDRYSLDVHCDLISKPTG